nr:hypothetical protein [Tanacetum cinerariifolium]
EAEVLTRSSNSSKTSYLVAADLSEMELKKILIDKMEGNKSIHRSDEQRILYKALVEAYESDKIILDTYGDVIILKRRCDDDANKDEEPSDGSDQWSKRRREGKEPESTSPPKGKATRTTGKSTQGSKSQQKTASESAPVEEPMQTTHDSKEPSHQEFVTGSKSRQTSASESATADEPMQTTHVIEEPSHPEFETSVNDQPIVEPSQHPERFSQQKKPPTPDQMELKKILIEKIEGNKSIHRSNEQINLYKALVEVYESDKIILDTYGDIATLKRRHDDDADKDKEPSAGSDRGSAGKSTQGSKSRQTSASESATADEPMQTTHVMEEPSHPEFETSVNDQPIIEPSQHPKRFSQQKKPPTPDRDWNKTLPATQKSIQPWISELAKQSDSRSSFNKLMDTPVDFFAFLMNRLKVDTLTLELLAGPTYELMKGSCNSLVELEFFLEEVYKATIDQLDYVNLEGQQYPHNLLKPLPLIPNSRGRRVIPFDHFINNDLEYLRGGASSRKNTTSVTKTKAADYGHIKWIEDLVPQIMWIQEPYTTSVTKTKAADYGHIKWIEDLVPRTIWSQEPVSYDKYAL